MTGITHRGTDHKEDFQRSDKKKKIIKVFVYEIQKAFQILYEKGFEGEKDVPASLHVIIRTSKET